MSSEYEIYTSAELERVMATKLAREYPLPPELSLMDEKQAEDYYGFLEFFELYGLGDHPLVRIFADAKINCGIASAIGKHAHYGDRLAHWSSWLGRKETISFVDATQAGTENIASPLYETHDAEDDMPTEGTESMNTGRKNAAPSRCPPSPLGGIRRPFFRGPDGYFECEYDE